jgi:hypothetical protein
VAPGNFSATDPIAFEVLVRPILVANVKHLTLPNLNLEVA